MGEINRALGSSGAGGRLSLGGKEYVLSPVTKRLQAEFEAWQEGRVKRQAAQMAADLPEDLAVRLLERVGDKIAAGHYTFGSDACLEALATAPGICHMLHLILRAHQPEMTPDAVVALLETHPNEVTQAIEELLSAGKAQAPAAAGAAP